MANKVCCDVCNRPIEGNLSWSELKAFTHDPPTLIALTFRSRGGSYMGDEDQAMDVCQPCGLSLLAKAMKRSGLELPHDD